MSSFGLFPSVASNTSDKTKCNDEALSSEWRGSKTTAKKVRLTEEQIKWSEDMKKLMPNCPVCFLTKLPSDEGWYIVNEHGDISSLDFIGE